MKTGARTVRKPSLRVVLSAALLSAVFLLLGAAAAAGPARAGDTYFPLTNDKGTVVGSPFHTDLGDTWYRPDDDYSSMQYLLGSAMDVATYGHTYVFNETNGAVWATPIKFAPGQNPVQQGNAILVLPQSSGMRFLGTCEVGGASPELYFFYQKKAGDGTLCWRRYTEQFGTERSAAAAWVDQVAWTRWCGYGAGWDSSGQPVSPRERRHMVGSVVAVDGRFVFVTHNGGTACMGYQTDLTTKSYPTLTDAITEDQDIRDVTAIPLTYKGVTYLAVGAIFGDYSPPYDQTPAECGPVLTHWHPCCSVIFIYRPNGDGSFDYMDESSYDWTEHNLVYGKISYDCGPLEIGLVRGGLNAGVQGDTITAVVQSGGGYRWDSWLALEATSEFVDTYTYRLEPGDESPITMDWDSEDYGSSWFYRNGDGGARDCSYKHPLATSFLVFPIYLQDESKLSVGDYHTWRQYICYISSVNALPNVNAVTKKSGTAAAGLTDPTGVGETNTPGSGTASADSSGNGWEKRGPYPLFGCLASDYLTPVSQDTTDENGNALPAVDPYSGKTLPLVDGKSAIKYPYLLPLNTDPSAQELVGILYGTPPTALNHNSQSDVFGSDAEKYSSTVFGTSQSAGTTDSNSSSGTAGVSLKWEVLPPGLNTNAIGADFSWSTDHTQVTTEHSEKVQTWQFWPSSTTPTHYGIALAKAPEFEVQRYSRSDWNGTAIAGESVYITNATSIQDMQYAFDQKSPGTKDESRIAPFNERFAGMTAAPDTTDVRAWHGRDPLAMASTHGKLVDGSKVASLTWTLGQGGTATDSFTMATAHDDSTTNTFGGSASFLFVGGGGSHSHTFTRSTSATKTMEVKLGLPQPPSGQKADITSLTVDAYWMSALDTKAYWIPTAYRTGANYQLPWCIDYCVVAYTDGPGAEGYSASARSCDVAARARPAAGGEATVLGAQRTASGAALATADEAGVLVSATPAEGYRFVGWKLRGSQARLRGAAKRTARVVATGQGGVTVEARFARIQPRRVSVKLRKGGRCDIRVMGACLYRSYNQASPVTVTLGGRSYSLASGQDSVWRTRADGSMTARLAIDGSADRRGRGSSMTLVLNPQKHRWSVSFVNARATDALLRGITSGTLELSLSSGARQLSPAGIPVAADGRFVHAHTAERLASRSGTGSGSSAKAVAAYAIDCSRATLTTRVHETSAARARFALAGVKVETRLLKRSGFAIQINEQHRLRLGPFKLKRGVWTYRGRNAAGVNVICRYTPEGRLSLALGGRSLEWFIGDYLDQNMTIGIGSGASKARGSFAPKLTRLHGVRVAPRVASTALGEM